VIIGTEKDYVTRRQAGIVSFVTPGKLEDVTTLDTVMVAEYVF
jgi:hypothetical protein